MTNSIVSKSITCRLVVLLSAYFMAQFDFFVVNVAAPSFERSLHAGPVALELIVGGYAFAYASGMITAGRLGDMLGQRRMFITGVLAFTVASLLCGLAQNPAELVTARLLQGLAGAMMVPQVLGTITATFPVRDRPRAIAWLGVTGGVAAVSGQVFGGWLLGADVLGLGWRVIFLVNVPIGLLAAVAARRVLEHRVAQPGAPRARLDLPGAAGVTATLALVLVPLTLGRNTGWPAWTWVCLACGLAAAGLTGYWQRVLRERGGQPVLETALYRVSTYAVGTAASVAFLAYFASFMFTLTLMLQGGFGLSPFRAGLAFAPMGVMFSITALLGRPLVARYGQRVVGAGCAIVAAGLVLFTVHPGLALVIAAAGIIGAGDGLVLPQLMGTALTQVRPEQAGVGSGMLTTAQQFAGSAGVTLIGTVFFAVLGTGDYAGAASATAIIYLALIALVAALVAVIAVRAREAPGGAAVHRGRPAHPAAERSLVRAHIGDPRPRHRRSATDE
jgi:EmrB/QacA subfamily drug resistance transporter